VPIESISPGETMMHGSQNPCPIILLDSPTKS
jgi:hypothetical protein